MTKTLYFSSVIAIFIFSQIAFAINCRTLGDVLKNHPFLGDDAKFWEALSEIDTSDARQLEQIVNSFVKDGSTLGGTAAEATKAVDQAADIFSGQRFKVLLDAQKAHATLEPRVKQKFKELMEILERPDWARELRFAQGRWNLERMEQFGQDVYSVKLNDGYRVLFRASEEGHSIMKIGNNIYRH